MVSSPTVISQAAFDLIVQEETGGRAYYEHRYLHPDWPRGGSGVTIGCGYDCGYQTSQDIARDWGGILPASMVTELQAVAGIKGPPARSHAASLHGIVCVPWDAAMKVFGSIDMPRYTAEVLNALPNARFLSPDSLGAIVSLDFNRGDHFQSSDDRYLEMRNIRAHMAAQNYNAIPAEFRAMKRIWPLGNSLHNDLCGRREREAVLFEKGLHS